MNTDPFRLLDFSIDGYVLDNQDPHRYETGFQRDYNQACKRAQATPWPDRINLFDIRREADERSLIQ